MNNEEVIERGEELISREDRDENWEAVADEQNKWADGFGILTGLTQDQLVQFLEITRKMSWDIPSALMCICTHLDADEHFWMHRPSYQIAEGPKGRYIRHEENNEYWEPADRHFKEVHELNLKDKRINWSFDT